MGEKSKEPPVLEKEKKLDVCFLEKEYDSLCFSKAHVRMLVTSANGLLSSWKTLCELVPQLSAGSWG